MGIMNYKNMSIKVFVVIVSLIMVVPTISNAVEITEGEEYEIISKVFVGTIQGMKVYNCCCWTGKPSIGNKINDDRMNDNKINDNIIIDNDIKDDSIIHDKHISIGLF